MPANAGNILWPTTVNGVTENFLERDWPLSSGRNFEPEEVNAGAKARPFWLTTARVLFGDANPIGQVVRLKQVPHMVIGVLVVKGTSNTGRDQDHIVVVPLKTARSRLLGSTLSIRTASTPS